MPVEGPSSNITVAIILGAHEWPHFLDLKPSDAFRHSAEGFFEYLIDSKGMALTKDSILNLFDCDADPDGIDQRIGDFLKARKGIQNIVIYYVGHGDTSCKAGELCLAIRNTRADSLAVSSVKVSDLSSLLKTHSPSTRRFLILDCCFAGAAFVHFQSEAGRSTMKQILAQGPAKGVCMLCSSSAGDAASSGSGDEYTIFSGAMLKILQGGGSTPRRSMSLRLLKQEIEGALIDFGSDVARPEVHSPDARDGDIGDIAFFPVAYAFGRALKANPPAPPSKRFEDPLKCYVLISEASEQLERDFQLTESIRSALQSYNWEIKELVGRSIDTEPLLGYAATAVSNTAEYDAAIAHLCRADVALFDITGYEPAVMLLLGVRAVVKRGITICVIAGDPVEERTRFPFNLQDINVIFDTPQTRNNLERTIGKRVVQALKELRQQPRYLDLPAYDAVRMLSPDRKARIPRSMKEQVLVLCPFDSEYQRSNWMTLRSKIPLKIKGVCNLEPEILRTLDIQSPRMVSQNLYESIRLTEFCLVDWSLWRANVFFELGVRLAASDIAPVCIIDRRNLPVSACDTAQQDKNVAVPVEGKKQRLPELVAEQAQNGSTVAVLTQSAALIDLFSPIQYRVNIDKDKVYRDMVDRHSSIRQDKYEPAVGELAPRHTFDLVTDWIDYRSESTAKPTYTELREMADLFYSSDVDTEGRSPVLYPKNRDLTRQAEEASFERRFAAWSYLDNRFSIDEIRHQQELTDLYRELGMLVAGRLVCSQRESDKRAATGIRAKIESLQKGSNDDNG